MKRMKVASAKVLFEKVTCDPESGKPVSVADYRGGAYGAISGGIPGSVGPRAFGKVSQFFEDQNRIISDLLKRNANYWKSLSADDKKAMAQAIKFALDTDLLIELVFSTVKDSVDEATQTSLSSKIDKDLVKSPEKVILLFAFVSSLYKSELTKAFADYEELYGGKSVEEVSLERFEEKKVEASKKEEAKVNKGGRGSTVVKVLSVLLCLLLLASVAAYMGAFAYISKELERIMRLY